ncbi:MAG: methyltransferase domain-containing protein [Dokdonella sp.]|uniref:methyltransferase domain-containing protein n=1 Tax=Dokdonella sp. TaxID=2291710 RepID=UPI0032669D65
MTGSDTLFSLPDVDALLRDELACIPHHAARLPGGRALIVQACAANRALPLDTRHLGAVRLHADQDLLRGDAICKPESMPWEDDAFQLVVVQHAGAHGLSLDGLIGECSRVLAPGGALLWFELNPWSPWLGWIHWQARRGMPLPRASHADSLRRRMHDGHLATSAIEYFGPCWPGAGSFAAVHRSPLMSPLRGAYLIPASKPRSVLIPLRQRFGRERSGLRPQLATPSRRASA